MQGINISQIGQKVSYNILLTIICFHNTGYTLLQKPSMWPGDQWRCRPAFLGCRGPALVDQPLSFSVHRYLDVLQLMVATYLQGREDCQTYPGSECRPGAKLENERIAFNDSKSFQKLE